MTPESEIQEIEFSVVTKTKGILTKRFDVDKKGKLNKDSTQCFLQHGKVERKQMMFSDIPELLDSLETNQAIVHGITELDEADLVSKGLQSKFPEAITRTKSNFSYPPYGLLMIDYDAPSEGGLTKTELITSVRKLCDQFKNAAMIWRPSASSCITDGKKINLGIKNQRIYMPYDGTYDDLKDFMDAIEMKSWEKKQGYIFISAAGTPLRRCLFDTAVFSPERLDFAAGACCEGGLTQTLPPTEYYPGDFVDLTDWPDDVDPIAVDILMDQAEKDVKDDIDKVRKEYKKKSIRKLQNEQKISKAKATQVVNARMSQKLLPDDIIYMNDNVAVSVRDILDNPTKYHNMVVRDPLEPSYGASKAQIYCDDDGIRVNSFAHGGRMFYVNYDREYYLNWLRTMDAEDVADVWSEGMKNFLGSNVDKEAIIAEVKDITGASKGALRQDVKEVEDRRMADLGVDIDQDMSHNDLAEKLLEEFPKHVVGVENRIFSYNGENCWKSSSKADARVKLVSKYDRLPLCRTTNHYDQIIRHAYTLIEDQTFFNDVPIGISTPDFFWKIEKGKLYKEEHSPSHRVRHLLPFNMPDEFRAEDIEMWMNFLEWCYQQDPEQIVLLQEVIGCIIYGVLNHYHQRAVLFRGDGQNGKSVVLDVIQKLIPQYYVSNVSPYQFDDNLYTAHMCGKLLNIVSELPKYKKIPGSDFKKVVDTGMIQGRWHYERPFDFPVMAAQVFSSNHVLQTDDDTDGMQRRWLMFGFDQKVPTADRIPHLGKIIARKEGGAILRWATEGMLRVSKSNNFTLTKSHHYHHAKMFDNACNISTFIEDEDMVIRGQETDVKCRALRSTMYNAYKEWCSDSGYPKREVEKKVMFNDYLEDKLNVNTIKTNKGVMWSGLQIRI